jgi:hypothetical protein
VIYTHKLYSSFWTQLLHQIRTLRCWFCAEVEESRISEEFVQKSCWFSSSPLPDLAAAQSEGRKATDQAFIRTYASGCSCCGCNFYFSLSGNFYPRKLVLRRTEKTGAGSKLMSVAPWAPSQPQLFFLWLTVSFENPRRNICSEHLLL